MCIGAYVHRCKSSIFQAKKVLLPENKFLGKNSKRCRVELKNLRYDDSDRFRVEYSILEKIFFDLGGGLKSETY